jgi:hypothetical protein
MLAIVGRILAVVLFIGGGLHAYGSFLTFSPGSGALVWSLGSAGFAMFLALLAFIANGPNMPLSILILLELGLAVWIGIVAAFGLTLPTFADPRVLYHLVVAGALMVQVALLMLQR